MLSEMSQTEKDKYWSNLHVGSKETELTETKSKKAVARGWGL